MFGNVSAACRSTRKDVPLLALGLILGFLVPFLFFPEEQANAVAPRRARGDGVDVQGAAWSRSSLIEIITTSPLRIWMNIRKSGGDSQALQSTDSGHSTSDAALDGSDEEPSAGVAVAAKWQSRELLYVGVLSAGRFLKSRIAACNRTWGQDLARGDLDFFVGEAPTEEYTGASIIQLNGVSDHEYPPQGKAFRMMQYMCKHKLDKYNWFLRADDDAYFRVGKIRDWLRTRDPGVKYYIGQAGYGRDKDKGRLQLNTDNFCMGGPGVIFSRAAMQAICPHLDACMQDNLTKTTGEEDVEIGRCISKYINVLCTSAYEFMTLFYHSYPQEYKVHPYLDLSIDRMQKVMRNALTLHHIKYSRVMYDVHNWYSSTLRSLWHGRSMQLRDQTKELSKAKLLASEQTVPEIEPPNVPDLKMVIVPDEIIEPAHDVDADGNTPQPEYETSEWVYADRTENVHPASSRPKASPDQLRSALEHFAELARPALVSRKLSLEKSLRLISHSDPGHGVRHLFEVAARKEPVNMRTYTYQVDLSRPFLAAETKAEPASAPDHSEVVIILPLAPIHYPLFQKFMKMYESNFLTGQQSDFGGPVKAHLFVVTFGDVAVPEGFKKQDSMAFDPALVVSLYQTKYQQVQIRIVQAQVGQPYSPLKALELGLRTAIGGVNGNALEDSVVMVTTVELGLSAVSVANCQSLADSKTNVLYPIVSLQSKQCSGIAQMSATPLDDKCRESQRWLKSSDLHFCASYKVLAKNVALVDSSGPSSALYTHLTALSSATDSVTVLRVYDPNLRIAWDEVYAQCKELATATSQKMAMALFAACAEPM